MITVPAKPEQVPALLDRLPQAEAAQLLAHGGSAVITGNIAASVLTWCGVDASGQPVTMGGIWPMRDDPETGYLWQIITPDVRHHKRAYLLQSRAVQAAALRLFVRLWVVIAPDHETARRHLRRLGWTAAGDCRVSGERALVFERTR